jgi:hypothetical protein
MSTGADDSGNFTILRPVNHGSPRRDDTMPSATKIPGFTADASIHNTGTYRHTPVDRGVELPAVVEPALPPGVECWTFNGMRQCAFSTGTVISTV